VYSRSAGSLLIAASSNSRVRHCFAENSLVWSPKNQAMAARLYEHGKVSSMATHFEIDDVIDPAETRTVLARPFAAVPPPPMRTGKKRSNLDT
jgi:acetyl-CoA carboxylase carboxyltransferase component